MLRTVSALVSLAFCFLLRVGECTQSPPGAQPRRTQPLRKGDVKLWHGKTPLDLDRPHTWAEADGVTICLENQKNGHKGETLHHSTIPGTRACPVQAAKELLAHLAGMPQSTPLGTYRDAAGTSRVSASQALAAVRHAAAATNLPAQGHQPTRTGTHSLRAGGAVALKLAGHDEATIMKLGRWSSRTFLLHIRTQTGDLAKGIAASMANALNHHNVN